MFKVICIVKIITKHFNFYILQIGQVIYNTIAARAKEEAQNYGDFFDVYGEELNNEVSINKNDLNDEIQQLFN